MPPLVFYGLALSGYSAKTRIVLEAKSIPYDEREPPGGYRSAEYRAIVPMGTIPAIVAEGFVLSESEAIAEYLEERFAEPSMLPGDVETRARARLLSRVHDLHLEPLVRSLFGHVDPARRDPAFVRARAGEIRERVAGLARFLGPGPFACTPTLSLADCGYATTLPLARMLLAALGVGLEPPPPVQRWQDALATEPAVVRALARWWPATRQWIAARTGAPNPQEPA